MNSAIAASMDAGVITIDDDGDAATAAAAAKSPHQARSIHWSPYDRVGVVNADP